jgi:hypothetical protein
MSPYINYLPLFSTPFYGDVYLVLGLIVVPNVDISKTEIITLLGIFLRLDSVPWGRRERYSPLETSTSALVGKLLKVSRVAERGSPRSDPWNPPLYSVLRIQRWEDVNKELCVRCVVIARRRHRPSNTLYF